MSIKSTARAYLRDALTAFDRAPAEVALAVFTAVTLSYALEGPHRFEAWVQLAVGAFIAFAFAWTATMLFTMGALNSRQRFAITIAGAVVAATYLLLVDTIEVESEGWRAFMLIAGVALLVFAAPGWVRSAAPASLRLRRINARFVLRAIGLVLYGLALFGGLALALTAIDKLFELKLDDDIYGHTFGWIMFVLVPWVIVGGLDSYVRPLEEVSDVARVVQRLTSFLVPPLLVLYYVILFVYAVRIALTGELPKNLVSPMVLAAGLLTALAAILFDPTPGDPRVGYRVLRYAPAVFLPLVPLGFWALAARIDEYGWTEFRLLRVVVLALLLVLALLATLELLRRRSFSLRVIPAVLGVALVLSAIGPWSVLAMARRDQQERLAETLREARIDASQPLPRDTSRRVVSRAAYERINNLGYYLYSHFGEDAVTEVMQTLPPYADGHWGLADRLRLVPAVDDTMPWITHGNLQPGVGVRLSSGTMYRVAAPSVHARVQGGSVTFTVSGEPLRATLDSLIRGLPHVRRRGEGNLPNIAVPVLDARGAVRGELILYDATVQEKRDSISIQRLDGVLIVR